MKKVLVLALLPSLVALSLVHAGSATWDLDPASNDWNTAANWTPATVPDGSVDTATFGVSNATSVFISLQLPAQPEVSGIVFNPEASDFTITANPAVSFTISGLGITNNSGKAQNFVTAPLSGGGGFINFTNAASAGSQTFFTNSGYIFFEGSSSAATGTFTTLSGGTTHFVGNSTAANGTFFSNGSIANDGAFPAALLFSDDATAANGTFVTSSSAVNNGYGAQLIFADYSTAANGVFFVNGGDFSGPDARALMIFYSFSTAGDSTLIANSGAAVGGAIWFSNGSSGGTASVKVFGNGNLDISSHRGTITIGSVEGDGLVFLGAGNLTTGSSNFSTLFSGTIQDGGTAGGAGGSLTKIGSGTLTLGGANTYTGGTTVRAGVLLVVNKTGSATGAGAVSINAGTLGGSGIIAGPVTIGGGARAVLAPAVGSGKQVTLTLQQSLNLQAGAKYVWRFNARTNRSRTDLVIANGVTINGATIALKGKAQGTLTSGAVLTVISNTSANPISGTFSNLANGAIVNVGANNFQASYTGGDGNDLTLTVVP